MSATVSTSTSLVGVILRKAVWLNTHSPFIFVVFCCYYCLKKELVSCLCCKSFVGVNYVTSGRKMGGELSTLLHQHPLLTPTVDPKMDKKVNFMNYFQQTETIEYFSVKIEILKLQISV